MSDATQLPRQDPGLPPGVSAHDIPGNEPDATTIGPARFVPHDDRPEDRVPPGTAERAIGLTPVRRPYKRGESKADIAIARHELMREVMALKNELAAARAKQDEMDNERIGREYTIEMFERENKEKDAEIARLKAAQCPWCRWRASRQRKGA